MTTWTWTVNTVLSLCRSLRVGLLRSEEKEANISQCRNLRLDLVGASADRSKTREDRGKQFAIHNSQERVDKSKLF